MTSVLLHKNVTEGWISGGGSVIFSNGVATDDSLAPLANLPSILGKNKTLNKPSRSHTKRRNKRTLLGKGVNEREGGEKDAE